ncbi:MAG TPA: hypothetical protein VKE42_05115 [Candidatus Cybelea sp.]|nr:hypothetical protein [Candidatus Cybelea sp.]
MDRNEHLDQMERSQRRRDELRADLERREQERERDIFKFDDWCRA